MACTPVRPAPTTRGRSTARQVDLAQVHRHLQHRRQLQHLRLRHLQVGSHAPVACAATRMAAPLSTAPMESSVNSAGQMRASALEPRPSCELH